MNDAFKGYNLGLTAQEKYRRKKGQRGLQERKGKREARWTITVRTGSCFSLIKFNVTLQYQLNI